MKDFYQEQAALFMKKAALVPMGTKGFKPVKGRSSLHQIIKTQAQADRFMRQLTWLNARKK